mmetsp:Transcript_6946/g.16076  ORF Transcript_6946/g.16076 Transcript_6946/m.16076 type:complete len:386 (+) Transcript_6946:544-1701(+)
MFIRNPTHHDAVCPRHWVGSGPASWSTSIRGSSDPALSSGTAFSGLSARSVRAATHLNRASVFVSSFATATSAGRMSPLLTTGTWFFISAAKLHRIEQAFVLASASSVRITVRIDSTKPAYRNMGILLSYPMARFESAEHALTRASKFGSFFPSSRGGLPGRGAVRVITAMSASITPGVRKTRFLFALEMDRFMRARHACVVHVVAPVLGWQVASATYPRVSTRPGVPRRAASLASALLRFLTQVVALRRASSASPFFLDELELDVRGGVEKCRPSMTSRIPSRTSGTLVISTLFDLPQLRFIMAMQAWRRALSEATPKVESSMRRGPGTPLSGKTGGGTATVVVTVCAKRPEKPDPPPVETCWTKGPPRATRASIWSRPGEFMR